MVSVYGISLALSHEAVMREPDCGQEQPCRTLWLAVLFQAKEDISDAPYDSLTYRDAHAFFVGGGAWVEARAHLADCLDMDPGAVASLGRRWINARRAAAGLAPEPPATPPAKQRPVAPRRMPVERPAAPPRLPFEKQRILPPAPTERPRAPRYWFDELTAEDTADA